MADYRIQRYTALARPLDPAYPTNRAVLLLLPAVALAAALPGIAANGADVADAGSGVTAALAAFGAWAVTRELAPDDNPAAFVAMIAATGVLLLAPGAALLPLFVALVLVRIVNRSTGRAPTAVDALLVLGFTLWAMARLRQPLLGFVVALAFVLDAYLPGGRRRQLAAAAIAAAFASLYLAGPAPPFALPGALIGASGPAVAAVSAAFLVTAALTRRVDALGDADEECLVPARVRAGMIVGWLVAVQALFTATRPALPARLLWPCLAAVVIGAVVRGIIARAARAPGAQ